MSLAQPEVEQALQKHGLRYEVIACDPNLADTTAFCEHYHFSPAQAANTIVVASKTEPVRYAACVVLATTRLDVNKKVCELMAAKRASFASAEQTLSLTHMQIGGVTIFGLPEDLPIYVDSAVMRQPTVVMGGGNRSSKVLINPDELTKLPNLHITASLANPRM